MAEIAERTIDLFRFDFCPLFWRHHPLCMKVKSQAERDAEKAAREEAYANKLGVRVVKLAADGDKAKESKRRESHAGGAAVATGAVPAAADGGGALDEKAATSVNGGHKRVRFQLASAKKAPSQRRGSLDMTALKQQVQETRVAEAERAAAAAQRERDAARKESAALRAQASERRLALLDRDEAVKELTRKLASREALIEQQQRAYHRDVFFFREQEAVYRSSREARKDAVYCNPDFNTNRGLPEMDLDLVLKVYGGREGLTTCDANEVNQLRDFKEHCVNSHKSQRHVDNCGVCIIDAGVQILIRTSPAFCLTGSSCRKSRRPTRRPPPWSAR